MAMHRFRVAEDSMRPALAPGEEFVASTTLTPAPGDVVALPHPGREDFWLVKRMTAGPGDLVDGHGRLARGEAWVSSDNRLVDGHDSRVFGPVPIETLRTRVRHLDASTFVEAVHLLAHEEEALAAVIHRYGVPSFWHRPEGLPTLVWLMMEQQVSLESGAAMYRRLHGLLGTITPEAIAGAGEEALRSIGVTRQKAGYLVELAGAIIGGDLDLEGLAEVDPSTARSRLLAIRGVGPWTADAYLLSALRLPDVFPVGDRALQVGTAEVLGLSHVPDAEELELVSLPWKPIRAAAARIIWHGYLEKRGRVEPSGPVL